MEEATPTDQLTFAWKWIFSYKAGWIKFIYASFRIAVSYVWVVKSIVVFTLSDVAI